MNEKMIEKIDGQTVGLWLWLKCVGRFAISPGSGNADPLSQKFLTKLRLELPSSVENPDWAVDDFKPVKTSGIRFRNMACIANETGRKKKLKSHLQKLKKWQK